jgi:hypothetical protein
VYRLAHELRKRASGQRGKAVALSEKPDSPILCIRL